MEKRKLAFRIGWVMLLFLGSCARDPFAGDLETIEGKEICVNLPFAVESAISYSRVSSPTDAEFKVNNLYVLVFNSDGSRDFGAMFPYDQLTSREERAADGSGITRGKITVHATSGVGKRIYALANIDNSMWDITSTRLAQVTSESQLQTLMGHISQNSLARGSNFLLFGRATDENGSLSIDFPFSSLTQTLLGVVLRLKHVDAKIKFTLKTATNVTFTPDSWRVVNASKTVVPFGSTPSGSNSDYFTSEWNNFEGEGTLYGRTFACYLLPNVLTPKQFVPASITDAAQRYACRELQDKIPIPTTDSRPGQSVQNGSYLYANDHSSYVQLKGNITYLKNNREISADVLYTIHLGYVGNDADDYATRSNGDYSYQVTIVSAEKIILEVETAQELQPGAEGAVVASKRIVSLDSHYGVDLQSFSSSDIDNSLTWYVNTPFESGSPNESYVPKDYQWVWFRLNSIGSLYYSEDYVKYTPAKYKENITLAEILGSEGRDKLLNVNQLVRILKENKARLLANNPNGTNRTGTLFDANGEIYFTVFIDEFYYESDPMTGATATVDFWKRFVNRPDRILSILSNTLYSPDGASMRTVAEVSYRQRSIKTMYNVLADASLRTAWGEECDCEGGPLPFWNGNTGSGTASYNDRDNGRKNTNLMWNTATTPNWSTYLKTETNTMQSNYQYARYACMSRNRDNNGNEKIDKNEVRWYLAAIHQLTDIWVGENSLDAAGRLFKGSSWVEDWYVSSSVLNKTVLNRDDPQVLWSSEGSSTGRMSSATGYSSTMKFNYRCVRDLGVDLTSDNLPQNVAKYDAATGVIDLKYLDRRSIRAYTQSAELPEHHEREPHNLPYNRFQIQKGVSLYGGVAVSWTTMRNAVNTGKSPCPAGYRLPNQRELALMMSRIGNDGYWSADNHFSRTRFSMNPTGGQRVGFSVAKDGQQMMLYLINRPTETGGVRCVKDL